MGQYYLTAAVEWLFIGNYLQDVFRLALTQFDIEIVTFLIQSTSALLVLSVSFGV